MPTQKVNQNINVRLKATYNKNSKATKISVVEMAKAGELTPYDKENSSDTPDNLAKKIASAAHTVALCEKKKKRLMKGPYTQQELDAVEKECDDAKKNLKEAYEETDEGTIKKRMFKKFSKLLVPIRDFLSKHGLVKKGGRSHITHKRKDR